MDHAVGGRDEELVAVVTVEVEQQRAGRPVGVKLLRPAVQHVLIAVQEELAAVLACHRRTRPGPGGADHYAYSERVRQRVRSAIGGLGQPAVLVAVETLDARGETGPQLRRVDHPERASV